MSYAPKPTRGDDVRATGDVHGEAAAMCVRRTTTGNGGERSPTAGLAQWTVNGAEVQWDDRRARGAISFSCFVVWCDDTIRYDAEGDTIRCAEGGGWCGITYMAVCVYNDERRRGIQMRVYMCCVYAMRDVRCMRWVSSRQSRVGWGGARYAVSGQVRSRSWRGLDTLYQAMRTASAGWG